MKEMAQGYFHFDCLDELCKLCPPEKYTKECMQSPDASLVT